MVERHVLPGYRLLDNLLVPEERIAAEDTANVTRHDDEEYKQIREATIDAA